MRGLAVGLAAAVALLGASPAGANTSKANTDSFTRSATIVNTNLQTCAHYSIAGALKYTAKRYGPTAIDHNVNWRLENIRVVSPSLSVTTFAYDPGSHACTSRRHRFSDIKVSERWAGFACNWNPSISISAPYAVGLSFWPSCGNKKAGVFTASKPTAGSAIVAGWDSERVSYPIQGLGLKPKGIRPDKPRCYGVVAKFTIRNGGSVRAFQSPVRHKVCPTPQW